MKKYSLRILCLSLFTLGLCLFPSTASGQSATPQAAEAAPKISIVISLQQDTLRFDDQALGVLEISNQGDAAVDDAHLAADLPGFLALHAGSCAAAAQPDSIDLGSLPDHSVKTQTFCVSLDPNTARAGSYTVLFEVIYAWGQKSDVISTEKTLSVDLIGGQTILGLPLAFAGFILPGLMFLITLRWFKAPWAASLTTEDKLIYGVMLSLVLIGPFALLGGLPSAPGWVQSLNFSQEVTIPRLVAYVVFGMGFGMIGGCAYQAVKWLQARQLANMRPFKNDDAKKIIQKALRLNPVYQGGRVSTHSEKLGTSVEGAHFAEWGDKLFIFSEFRLDIDQLDPNTQERVRKIVGDPADFGKDPAQILRVLQEIHKLGPGLIKITDPLLVIEKDTGAKPQDFTQKYLELPQADFSEPQTAEKSKTVLMGVSTLKTNGRLATTKDQKPLSQ